MPPARRREVRTGARPAPTFAPRPAYGVSSLILVNQLASETRVAAAAAEAGQGRRAGKYSASVQVWPMYSEAIQMSLPSVTAAP